MSLFISDAPTSTKYGSDRLKEKSENWSRKHPNFRNKPINIYLKNMYIMCKVQII